MNNEEPVFVDEEDTQKRRRAEAKRKYVSEACIECKKRHAKCDGKSPCGNCTMKELVCSFPEMTVKKKRGPAPGSSSCYIV